jgi:hypothetical protein
MKMKPAITRTTTILVSVLAAGLASAQSPRIIQNTRGTMNSVSSQSTAASNEALASQPSGPVTSSATHTHTPAHTPAPAKQHPATTTSKAPAKPAVTIRPSAAPAGAHVADARGRRHWRRRWVNGVLVEEPLPGSAEGSQRGAEEEASSSVSATAGSGEGEPGASEQPVVPDSKYAANGRRDPFISPVVSHAGGSGCSTGKKCLEIGAINLRGVVRAESGFIAVVSNGLNKAYFLRENDPVFNGYVVKITGDSIVFQETLQDRLGKTFTREVVKKIVTPAV